MFLRNSKDTEETQRPSSISLESFFSIRNPAYRMSLDPEGQEVRKRT